jgi:hypothetical protein
MDNRRHRPLSVQLPRAWSEPDVSPAHKRAIERALRWAWSELCHRWPQIVKTGTEEAITSKMQLMLNLHATDHRRCAPGLRSFETVNRGAKVVTADGRIEKMPDLVFRPPVSRGVRNRSEWGYFVECKIIDGSVTIRLYCKEGVTRFVNGEYCARMPSGGMLAYVRDASTPYISLQPHLEMAFETQSHISREETDMSDSLHSRRGLSNPCVDIALTHLWLRT